MATAAQTQGISNARDGNGNLLDRGAVTRTYPATAMANSFASDPTRLPSPTTGRRSLEFRSDLRAGCAECRLPSLTSPFCRTRRRAKAREETLKFPDSPTNCVLPSPSASLRFLKRKMNKVSRLGQHLFSPGRQQNDDFNAAGWLNIQLRI
jgi:hypothetical protein